MDLTELLSVPIVGELKENGLPSPEEYNYWVCRKNRTFFIDYQIDDNYDLVELGKVIVQMNMEERDIPKEELAPIYLYIFSYGGDLDQGLGFCDLIMSSRIPIVTISMGITMSAAFLIFLAGQRRYAFKHSQMLVHSGFANIQGTAEQIDEAQKNYKKQLNSVKEYILARTTIDEKTFNKNRSKDWYLNSEELVNYNVVDKLVTDFEEIM